MNLPENPTREQVMAVMLAVIQSQATRGNVERITQMSADDSGIKGQFIMDGVEFAFQYSDGELVFQPVNPDDLQ
jgi:hypothetical protein